MNKIIPHLWFDSEAEESARLYTSLFVDSKLGDITRYGEAEAKISGQPEGSILTVSFELAGQSFVALNGGPYFKFSPATSFLVNCQSAQELDAYWTSLVQGGTVLMELGTYPFSPRYGWLADKFGVSWQLSLVAGRAQRITPFLLFVGNQHGRAEEAINFYTSLFKDSAITKLDRYGAGEAEPEGTVKHATFSLAGQEFMAIDSNYAHQFTFTPAISFLVNCATQHEVDAFWDKLTDGGVIEQCGWLRDQFGVSWQIVPTALGKMMRDTDAARRQRVMRAMLQMKKLDIAALERAYA